MPSMDPLLSGRDAAPSRAFQGYVLPGSVCFALLTGFACGALISWPHGSPDFPTVELPALTARAQTSKFPQLGLAPGSAQYGLSRPMTGGLLKSLRKLPVTTAAKEFGDWSGEMETRKGWGTGDWSMYQERLRCNSNDRLPKEGDEVFNKMWVFAPGGWKLAADDVATVVEVNPNMEPAGRQFKLKNPAGETSDWLYVTDYWYNTPERMEKLAAEKAALEAAAVAEAAAKKAAAEKKAKEAATKKAAAAKEG